MERKGIICVILLFLVFSSLAQESNLMMFRSAREIVSSAVLNGLQKSGMDSLTALTILADKKLFVSKCQICEGTKSGLQDYIKLLRQERVKPVVSYNPGDFSSKDFEKRYKALENMVAEYTGIFLKSGDFTLDEVQQMHQLLEKERKQSMTLTKGKNCASCDGACSKADQ
jgi:hypothetical protein